MSFSLFLLSNKVDYFNIIMNKADVFTKFCNYKIDSQLYYSFIFAETIILETYTI